MNELSSTVSNTKLWGSTLAFQNDDKYKNERERLRSSFLNFRKSSAYLASEIRKDLPNLTIHDLTHLDALWEIGSIITGENYALTPTEAFVLGGAILLHDLGMSIAAIEGGYTTIQEDPRWADLVTFEYQTKYERMPTGEEILNPEVEIQKRSLFNLLRQIHADNAEKLAFLSFNTNDNTSIFLIDDVEIRQTFGRIVGQIAHSHWWSISDVEKHFGRVIGAPHWCPPEWTIDPIKIACLLRAADACHLDARRAPTFIKAFTNLSPSSLGHWTFQEKLNKPYLGEDALIFTSSRSFKLPEAAAWWLCLDALRMADRELRSVDALFAEKSYQRFAAKRIAGVDSLERLASYVHTEGWLPINAMVHVTDLPSIIQSIGGKELYGDQPQVALRELIQNACDAIRARCVYEKRSAEFGNIIVKLTEDNSGQFWLEVIDSGIGMSQRVLTEFLLDFGRSFWGSPEMQEELPGLLSSGMKSTGKYGIGFFSIFMISEHVQVATRRSDLAARETQVLEFSFGLEGRPILRPAEKKEQLLDGGTHIKMRLKKNPYQANGLLFQKHERVGITLTQLVKLICPAIDTNLSVIEKNVEEKVITANDWKTMDGSKLLERMRTNGDHQIKQTTKIQKFKKKAAANLRNLVEDNGEIVGRALITTGYALLDDTRDYLSGVVTVGGLEATRLSGICGVLLGQTTRASREDGKPVVTDLTLRRWAEEQAEFVPGLWKLPEQQAACAQYIWMCGGETKGLPICKNQGKWLSADEIASMVDPPEVIIMVDHFTIEYELKVLESYTLDSNVFITALSGLPGLLQSNVNWPRDKNTNFIHGPGDLPLVLAGSVILAISRAWKISGDIVKTNDWDREEDIRIGTTGNRELRVNAVRISKPKT